MVLVLLLAGAVALANVPPQPRVRSIEIEGNRRIPAATVLYHITTRPQSPFSPEQIAADLRKLHSLGFVRRAVVSARPAAAGLVDVIVHVEERPFVRSFTVAAGDEPLEEKVRRFLEEEKLGIALADPFDPARAQKAAVAVRAYLMSQGHPQCQAEIDVAEADGAADVRLAVDAGQRIKIGEVVFEGNRTVPDAELAQQLEVTKPARIFDFRSRAGVYSPDDLLSDVDRLRKHYRSLGFAEASIGEPRVTAFRFAPRRSWPLSMLSRPGLNLSVHVPIVEGPPYEIDSVRVEGDGGGADAEIQDIIGRLAAPRRYDLSLLEAARLEIVQALGRHGYVLARVELVQDISRSRQVVGIIYRIDAGDPRTVGRIRFEGNGRLKDQHLRRLARIEEGDVFSAQALDESIERLNRSGLIEKMDRRDVRIEAGHEGGEVDICFPVREKDRQGIFATGGSGGIGGSYLGVIYQAINLLGMGEELSLELDGGAAQSNLLLSIVGRHFLGSPFSLALAAFHRATDISVASIVPGAQDLVALCRRRSAGASLSGSYSISPGISVGLGFQHERVSGRENRSSLAPGVDFQSAGGDRAAFGLSLAGNSGLTRIESAAYTLRLRKHSADPWSGGRNSFVFQLQGSVVRPTSARPLAPDLLLFPGDELVRGFPNGGLAPWNQSMDPVGADTAVGLSLEYRIPLLGPASGAAFFDLGWSSLASRGKTEPLIAATNGVLRSSVGGELRLQLPLIRQPVRAIFAWNPLRLDKVVDVGGRPLRLADPRRSLRLAFGNLLF